MSFVTVPMLWLGTRGWTGDGNSSSVTLDATNESLAVIGQVFIEGGAASKTISAAGGGAFYFRAVNIVTFANASTNLRIGVQDVTAGGVEDGTFDVYADLVGGTATINANVYNRYAMTSGTKTISNGDVVAFVATLTNRAGADGLNIRCFGGSWSASTQLLPYGVVSIPTQTKAVYAPSFLIEFDDGTIGWMSGMEYHGLGLSTFSYAANSSPDEYGAAFTVPFGMKVGGIGLCASGIASADTYEIILYSDPYGSSPSVLAPPISLDPDFNSGSNAAASFYGVISEQTLVAGSTYAITLRPTTNNSINYHYSNLGAGCAAVKTVSIFGTSTSLISRTNNTGAFADVNSGEYMPSFMLGVTALDDGTSVGGGSAVAIFGG